MGRAAGGQGCAEDLGMATLPPPASGALLRHELSGMQRPSWLGGVGNRGCLLQELRPHAPRETTWWEIGPKPKPSIMGEPKEQVLALGLPASPTATPVPAHHPPHPRACLLGSAMLRWCHSSVLVSPCGRGGDHVGLRARQVAFLGLISAAWGHVPWHLGTDTSSNLFTSSLEERLVGRRDPCQHEQSADAWVLLSKKAKLGSVQTLAARQPQIPTAFPCPACERCQQVPTHETQLSLPSTGINWSPLHWSDVSQSKSFPSRDRHKPKDVIHPPWGNRSWELVRGRQPALCRLSRAGAEDEVTHVHEEEGEFSHHSLT